MKLLKHSTKNKVIIIWLAFIASVLYLYFFQSDFVMAQITKVRLLPLFWLCTVYLIINCLRGFTFIPVTYTMILGLIFLPTPLVYILTVIGVGASATCIYYFSEYLSLGTYFKQHYPKVIEKLTNILKKYELPIIAVWSFMPVLATDAMCYVCGTLRINFKKFLIGVVLGEGIFCALFIFLGKDFAVFITRKIFGL
jgi:uncharacterized membrane protein YdjX (TVP38/TMEM64 family)